MPWVVLVLFLAASPAAAQVPAPELIVISIGPDPGMEARLRQFDRDRLRDVVRLVGLDDAGGPIRVLLAPESSDVARETPGWIAGVAQSAGSTIVLFPSRSPRYPDDSLEEVLHHEVAHVLIGRAARGRPVPRWFNEGLAVVAERTWSGQDRRQLAWALAARDTPRMHDIDAWFNSGPGEASRAYALAGAFVRDVMEWHGADSAARILGRLAEGRSFDAAFADATGESLEGAERRFAREITSWDRWIPLVTSPIVFWMAVTLLALAATWRAHRRRAARRRDLERELEEEIAEPGTLQ